MLLLMPECSHASSGSGLAIPCNTNEPENEAPGTEELDELPLVLLNFAVFRLNGADEESRGVSDEHPDLDSQLERPPISLQTQVRILALMRCAIDSDYAASFKLEKTPHERREQPTVQAPVPYSDI
ncbi:hypothetical protein R3P38DRAFT_2781953 [Favolaschia claudopus]|uniref:Uncharacterized protein n=1 Tax=Favolaschia claudopus TaxID=2862362 RepID=A0AAW0B2Y9_9AGAR